MNASNKFNIETIKSFARTTNANRVKAVQMICSGDDAQQCKENARLAYLGCLDDGVVGIDKGTLELFKQLSHTPLQVWTSFTGAGNENAEGEKLAAKLIKLAQALALCKQYSCSYVDGYDDGYKNGYNVGYADGCEDSGAASGAASGEDSEDSEAASEDSEASKS